MRTRSFFIALLALAAVAVAGCGGSSKAAGVETAPSAGATEAAIPTTPKPPPALAKKPVVSIPKGAAPTKLVTKDLVQGTGQRLLERLVPFFPLHLHGLIEQLATLEVVQHEPEEVDVLDPQPVLLPGDVVEERVEVVPDPQFVFGRVVEDVKGDLVAEAAAAQEVIGDDPGQNLVQALVEGIAHGATWMQRRT